HDDANDAVCGIPISLLIIATMARSPALTLMTAEYLYRLPEYLRIVRLYPDIAHPPSCNIRAECYVQDLSISFND
ncbi:MAG: hypothetical protein WBO18_16700, partial [Gammaproteobacteria bacterium]